MSIDKRDFYGKEVTEAIKKACEKGDADSCMMVDQIKMHLEML